MPFLNDQPPKQGSGKAPAKSPFGSAKKKDKKNSKHDPQYQHLFESRAKNFGVGSYGAVDRAPVH